MVVVIPERSLKWRITIKILKSLGKRYVMGRLKGGKLLFIDKQRNHIVYLTK
jgi:hypothetical protein